MRNLFLLLSFALLGIVALAASEEPVQRKTMRYVERISEKQSGFQNQGLPPKEDRVSSNSGDIKFIIDDELPDSIMTALNAAKTLWEAKIANKYPVWIYVGFESIGDDISMISEVSCLTIDGLRGCPSALASQISDKQYGSETELDGLIIFNSDVEWNCSFSKESISNYNLPTMALRGIAKCLGFGSTIVNFGGKFEYYFSEPSYFDKLLYADDTKLEDLKQKSVEMSNFVQSDNVYARTETQTYKMYAPRVYEDYSSLCYFDDDSSIMSYWLGNGNIDLTIDDNTTDLLKTIGWKVKPSGYEIKCDKISENGICSAYDEYIFYLDIKDGIQQNFKWRFFLKNKSGEFEDIAEDTAETLYIHNLGKNAEKFYVNINGDLEGKVECDYRIDGQLYTATMSLAIELKPEIFSIENVKVIPSTTYGAYATFDVYYAGADHLYANVEEEFSSTMRSYKVDEPYIAHVKTGNISRLFYSWVTIVVSNKYGETRETIEFEPSFSDYAFSEMSLIDADDIVQVQLFNIYGILVFTGSAMEYMSQTFPQGIYIKKETLKNGLTQIAKISIH